MFTSFECGLQLFVLLPLMYMAISGVIGMVMMVFLVMLYDGFILVNRLVNLLRNINNISS